MYTIPNILKGEYCMGHSPFRSQDGINTGFILMPNQTLAGSQYFVYLVIKFCTFFI